MKDGLELWNCNSILMPANSILRLSDEASEDPDTTYLGRSELQALVMDS